MSHIPVLTKEAVKGLNLKPDSVVVDCTLGAGGHAKAVLEKLDERGTFVGIDIDKSALESTSLGEQSAEVHLVCGNFRNLKSILSGLALTPTAILADLGWRTEQFEEGGKGLSFKSDEPLLMTLGDSAEYTFTAFDIVNTWEEESLADIIYGYGEERHSRRIAKAIVEGRKQQLIRTAKELAELIESSVPTSYRRGRIHPATKTFQAIRMTVNDELGALKDLLKDGFTCLAPGGRLAIISFHSLEDRLVKNAFRDYAKANQATLITKKPITATKEELAINPRARSAKLRILQHA